MDMIHVVIKDPDMIASVDEAGRNINAVDRWRHHRFRRTNENFRCTWPKYSVGNMSIHVRYRGTLKSEPERQTEPCTLPQSHPYPTWLEGAYIFPAVVLFSA